MGADKFAEIVKQKSKGDIEVKVFPSSQLGTQKELIEGLIYGTVDMYTSVLRLKQSWLSRLLLAMSLLICRWIESLVRAALQGRDWHPGRGPSQCG